MERRYSYTVIITFDLSYASRSDYRLINRFLEDKGFYALSSSGNNMPANTYTGEVEVDVNLPSGNLTLESMAAGAEKARTSVYASIYNAMKNSGIPITLFVQASFSKTTSSRCTRN